MGLSMKIRNDICPQSAIQGYYLNEKQRRSLATLRIIGWELICARREPLAITILKNKQDKTLGVLCSDGTIRRNDEVEIRQSDW